MKTTCKRCLLFSEVEENPYETIKGYIDSLDEVHKIEEEAYEERLSKCNDCDALINGMCKYCGCFVIVRAIKRNQVCPYPNRRKW